MTRADTPFSPHGNVVLDKLHVLQPAGESESSSYRVPRSLSMSIASDQCCTCPVFPSDNHGKTVEISAFLPSADSECVHLHCEGVAVHRFTFRDDTLLGIKLLPLPGSKNETVGYQPVKKDTAVYSQVVGVILILVSLRKGLSIFSIVLDQQEGSGSFTPVECREVRPRTSINDKIWHGRRIRSLAAAVVNSNEESTQPFLFIAASSSLESPEQTPADQRLDIQQYILRNHKCPIFHFTTGPSAEIPPFPPAVAVEDVGRVIDMTFGTISASGFISLAVITSSQLTVVHVALPYLRLLRSARLLLTGCHPTHRLGVASTVVCLGAQDGDVDMESFAVVCKPKSSDFAYTPPVQTRKMIGSYRDAFTWEETPVTKTANSPFSLNLMDRKKASRSGQDILIEDTVSSTMKEFPISHLDEAMRVEQEALNVVTPETKIVDITDERSDKTNVVDASVSVSPVQTRKMIGSHGDAFTLEETPVTKTANSPFSLNLMDRKKASRSGQDILIEDTVSSTMKEFPISHFDEAMRVEQEALNVVTPETKIVDITDERIGDKTNVVDASVSVLSPRRLSPLMGLTPHAYEGTADESSVMNSLVSNWTKTPMKGRLSSPGDICPEHAFHLIIARVKHVGGNEESKIKVTPVAMPFPYEMTRLEVLSLRPFNYCPDESRRSPTTRGALSFEALMSSPPPMFSPSPGKLMSPLPDEVASEGPRFSIVCKEPDSQELFSFVVSVNGSRKLCIESQTQIDLYRVLPDSLAVLIKSLSVKGTAIDEASIAMKAGRLMCSSIIRLVLKDSDGLAPASNPINLSLEEDGTVFILALSCTIPLYSDQVRPPQREDSREQTDAIESSLGLILEKLTSFEKEVYRRMDVMEQTIKENSERVGALEAALVKDRTNAETP